MRRILKIFSFVLTMLLAGNMSSQVEPVNYALCFNASILSYDCYLSEDRGVASSKCQVTQSNSEVVVDLSGWNIVTAIPIENKYNQTRLYQSRANVIIEKSNFSNEICSGSSNQFIKGIVEGENRVEGFMPNNMTKEG